MMQFPFSEDGFQIWLFGCQELQSSLLRLLPLNQEEDLHHIFVFPCFPKIIACAFTGGA